MASGDTIAMFFPVSGEPPASNYATLFVRAKVMVLEFDPTTDETIEFPGFMPRQYAGGGITVTVGWMGKTATTGTISLDVAFKSISDDADDIDTKGFATSKNTNPTTASASGEVDYATISFSDGSEIDSIAAGEYFRIEIKRDADGTSSTDDMAGDMQLVFVELKEN